MQPEDVLLMQRHPIAPARLQLASVFVGSEDRPEMRGTEHIQRGQVSFGMAAVRHRVDENPFNVGVPIRAATGTTPQ